MEGRHCLCFILNMVFLTLVKRISPQVKKLNLVYLANTAKVYSYGRIFSIQHFYINWEEFGKTRPFKISTPLFNFSIGYSKMPFIRDAPAAERAIRANPRTYFLTCNSNHTKRAHSVVFRYGIREGLFRLINEAKLEDPKHNVISIYFNCQAVFATHAEIYEQVRQCLQKYKGAALSEKSKVRPKSVYDYLFPFDLDKCGSAGQIKRYYQSIHGEIDSPSFNTIIAHYYRLTTSFTPRDLNCDLRDFRMMLQKFDFIKLIMKIEKANSKHSVSRCRRLVRILKWRTKQAEDYLIFLINEFGQENLKRSLELFEKVYQDFSAHSPAVTQ